MSRPSIAIRLEKITSIPLNTFQVSVSPRMNTPRRIALIGIRNVTNRRFVAPAIEQAISFLEAHGSSQK
jgi:hypothetical protein